MRAAPGTSRLLPAAALSSLLLAAGCTGNAEGPVERAASGTRGSEIEAHLRFLSHDLLEGRAPGSRGGRLAAEYIASRFRAAGLERPEGGPFLSVSVVGSTPEPASVSLTLHRDAESVTPEYPSDFVLWSGDPDAASVQGSAGLVFAGYGTVAPEHGWDDFEGTSVAGKVLLVLVNDPPAPEDDPARFGGRAMTYYGRWTYKLEEAARQGALGVLLVHETGAAGYPWAVVRGSWTGEQLSLPRRADGRPPVPLQGWLTRETAARALDLAGLDLDSMARSAARPEFRAVDTGIRVRAGLRSRVRRLETENVAGLVRGGERPEEAVVVTAHYDHLGVGEPLDGDSIYNGAYDNASGTALLLEIARAFASTEPPPSRSLLFLATAAEEAGLLGAEAYVRDPVVPLRRTVAAINVDGANLWGETDDVIVLGADRSELGPFVEARARELGMAVAPDAEPEKGFFFRSDHFPFARAGVPALYVEHGRRYRGRPEGWGDSIQARYTAEAYHAPGDELDEGWRYDGAVQQARLVFLTAWDLATVDNFPNWDPGTEFRAARERMMEGGDQPP